jgi:hypothetical protein
VYLREHSEGCRVCKALLSHFPSLRKNLRKKQLFLLAFLLLNDRINGTEEGFSAS